MKTPRIVSLEGGEGSGKTTVLNHIIPILLEEGVDFISSREPGGVDISEQIRNVILDTENTTMDGRTEALLFAAARRQHLVEKVLPALNEGKLFIFDRYIDSSLVYQGFVRETSNVQQIYDLNQFAIEGLLPDLTIYFDVDPKVGLARVDNASENREVNRLDKETLSFHYKVREGYLSLSKIYSDRYIVVDASRSLEEVVKNVLDIFKDCNII